MFDLATSAEEFTARLGVVQRALYLLFNEGYHGAGDAALGALMCLHAARLPARLYDVGDLVSLLNQDRTRWDQELLREGIALLERAATGDEVTPYHVEAAIAAVHTESRSAAETRWDVILSLYDTLLAIRPSPVVALQRALAVAQVHGPERGLEAIRAIDDRPRLASYPFYYAALGELELRSGDAKSAATHFGEALALARNALERRFLTARIAACAG